MKKINTVLTFFTVFSYIDNICYRCPLFYINKTALDYISILYVRIMK